jgi:hypothetical protein
MCWWLPPDDDIFDGRGVPVVLNEGADEWSGGNANVGDVRVDDMGQ